MFEIYKKLSKFNLSLAIAFSTLTGCFFFSGRFNLNSLWATLGVFFLSAAASTLNQVQEREHDAVMNRTKKRPLPSGLITVNVAMMYFWGNLILGSLVLSLTGSLSALLLGLGNLVWYNFVYTYSKRMTSFSVIVGSVNGAIPPMIGWAAAGGNPLHPTIMFFAFFIFLWQMPHFWLLLIKYGEEYREAGFHTLNVKVSDALLKRIIFLWTVATSVSSMFFPYFHIMQRQYLAVVVVLLNFAIIVLFYRMLFKSGYQFSFRKAFMAINFFMLLVLVILILDRI